MKDGFEMTIVPWYCEVIFEDLAEIVQTALNAEQGVFAPATELQVMASMATRVAAGQSWADSVATAKG